MPSGKRPASEEDHVRREAQQHLEALFPEGDPGFLAEAIRFYATKVDLIKGKGKARRAEALTSEIVEQVSTKLLEINHNEYPRTVFMQSKTVKDEKKKGKGVLVEMVEIKKTWSAARRRASGSGGSLLSEQGGGREVNTTLARNQAMYVTLCLTL